MSKLSKGQENGINYCPNCTHSLQDAESIVNEYWISENTAYYCWCKKCSWNGEIIKTVRITAYEMVNIQDY